MLTICRMRGEDVREAAKLESRLFRDSWSERGIRDALFLENTLLLAAFKEGSLIGYAIFYIACEEGELVRIGVEPAFQGRGTGRALLREIEKFCKERGIGRILLEVRESNEAAKALYRGEGFREDGIRRNFYTRPLENAALMSRDIGKRLINEETLSTGK